MSELMILSEGDMRACLTDTEAVLGAVESGVRAYAMGQAQAFPTLSMPGAAPSSGIYTIRGVLSSENLASVKTVGSYPGNRAHGLPADPGLMTLIDTETGVPRLVAGASHLTTIRTAAMTALGAAYLQRPGARVIGCIGARGIAPVAAEMVAARLPGAKIKVHSRGEETRRATVESMIASGLDAEGVTDWDTCVEGSDILIDGASLPEDAPLLRGDLLAEGALVISYSAKCSLDDAVIPAADRIILDRWDPTPSGAMGRLIGTGALTENRIDAFFGDVVLGKETGRRDDRERILFWHRGLGACDIALANMALAHATQGSLGMRVNFG